MVPPLIYTRLKNNNMVYIKKGEKIHVCKICKKETVTSYSHKKYCSEKCWNIQRKIDYGYPKMKIPTLTRGAVSELIVATDLMQKGWDVFRALSPSSFCDLLAMKRDETRRVIYLEVRTAYRNQKTGTIFCPNAHTEGKIVCKVISIEGENDEIIYSEEI